MAKKTKKELLDECFALDVTNYSDYIERTAEIIANVVATAPTLQDLTPMTGVKANHTVQLNILDTSVVFSNADCVNTATGDATVLSPRNVTVKRLTAREEMCLDVLDSKLPMIQSAGARNEELPFAALYMDLKIAEVGKWLEKMLWQGDTTIVGTTNNLNKVTGFLKIADGETGALGYYDTITATDLLPANIVATVQGLINNRTAEMYEMENVKIWMSQGDYATLQQALLKDYGIYGAGVFENTGKPDGSGMSRSYFLGTNVEIIGTHGLNGNRSIFMTNHNNLRYVTDMESDKEHVEIFFDKYHKRLVSDIIFAMGFQYEFPENVGYLKFVAS